MEKEKQILDINNWALQYPHRVFDNDFLLQRRYLTEETWKAVILANPDMLDSASPKWRHIPNADIVNKYQGRAFSGEVRKAINEDGVKVALGALAIPTVIAGGVPFLEAAGNTALTAGQALYYKPVQTLTNFGAGLVGGITGSLATDAIVRSTTDLNNFGEWFNYKTGLPETVGHFLNPGGLIGGGLAAGVTNKLLYPWASNLDRSIVISRMLNNGVKNVDLSKVYRPNITSKSRFKLGDVEIYDPNLYYRQIGSKVAREFPKTGRLIPTLKEVGYGDDLASVHNRSLRFKLGKVPFENPMYAEGNLWYGIPQKGNIDGLLVTNIPMRWATKSSKPTDYGPIKISEDGLVTTVRTGFDVGNVGSRRIPYEGTITPQNTTAYEFIPGYGYRKILMHPQKVSYKFYERPSTLTEAERLGIPKGERNLPYVEGYRKRHPEDIVVNVEKEKKQIIDLFNKPIYRDRLLSDGYTELEIDDFVKNQILFLDRLKKAPAAISKNVPSDANGIALVDHIRLHHYDPEVALHEFGHLSEYPTFFFDNLLPKITKTSLIYGGPYYKEPGEVRTRALGVLLWLDQHGTTLDDFYKIVSDRAHSDKWWSTLNERAKEFLFAYPEDLGRNYLLHFRKQGGIINYLNLFK